MLLLLRYRDEALHHAPCHGCATGLCGERLMSRIRRECLEHMMVFHERHRTRILTSDFAYYTQN